MASTRTVEVDKGGRGRKPNPWVVVAIAAVVAVVVLPLLLILLISVLGTGATSDFTPVGSTLG